MSQEESGDKPWKQYGSEEEGESGLFSEGQKEWITTPGFLALWGLILCYGILKGSYTGTLAELNSASGWAGYLVTGALLSLLYAAFLKWVYLGLKSLLSRS